MTSPLDALPPEAPLGASVAAEPVPAAEVPATVAAALPEFPPLAALELPFPAPLSFADEAVAFYRLLKTRLVGGLFRRRRAIRADSS